MSLENLAAENSSLKEEMEYKLTVVLDQKSTVEDYSEKIEAQIVRSEGLRDEIL